jgi:hypothetical protein
MAHILTMRCAFTGFVQLKVVKDETARAVADALAEWIGLFGIPSVVYTDRGTQFTSQVFTELVKRHHVTPHVFPRLASYTRFCRKST